MAIPEGGPGSTRTVYIDSVRYTSGSSRTVINRREKRGNTWYVYRTIYRHYSPPKGTGGGGNPPQQQGGGGSGGGGGPTPSEGGSGPREVRRTQRRNAWIIARQRLLRTLGYPVRVDGVWGSISQTYWSRYTKRGGTASTSTAAAREAARARDLQRRSAVAASRIRREKSQELARVRRTLDTLEGNRAGLAAEARYEARPDRIRYDRLEARRERIPTRQEKAGNRNALRDLDTELMVARARLESAQTLQRIGTLLGQDERNAARLTTDQVLLLVTHGMDATAPRNARILQRFLRRKGHDIPVDGVFGERSSRALLQEFRAERNRERAREISRVVGAFYDSGLLKSNGERPEWWPLYGAVPTPNELRQILQRGGFAASMIWATLQRQLREPHTEYLLWRNQEIRRVADAVMQQFGPSGELNSLERLGSKEGMATLAMRTMSQHYAILGTTQERAQSEARWRALFSAWDIKDFQKRLHTFEREEEAEWRKLMADRANDRVWWAEALHQITRPGEYAQTQFVADWMRADDLLHGEELANNEVYRARADAEIADWPFAAQLAYAIAVDPINFIPFTGIASITTRASLKGITLSGRGLSRISHTFVPAEGSLRDFGVTLAVAGRGIEEAGLNALYVPQAFRAAKAGVLSAPGIGTAVTKATTLKLVAREKAARAVELSMRHGFRVVSKKVAGLRYADEFAVRNPKTKALLEASTDELKTMLPSYLRNTVSDLQTNRVALYVDHARQEFSSVGAAMRAHLYEAARINEARRVADTYAERAASAFRDRFADPKVRANYFKGRPGYSDDAVERMMNDEAAWVYRDEFERVKEALGSYILGAGDPELTQLLYSRVFAIGERIDQHILPILQDLMDDFAEEGGYQLFDDAGLWLGRNDVLQHAMKMLTKDSFDPSKLIDVPNPMYSKVLPANAAEDLMESEIRRRKAGVVSWASRERAKKGEFRPETEARLSEGQLDEIDDFLTQKFVDIEDDVRSHWTKIDGDTFKFTINETEAEKLRAKLGIPNVRVHFEIVPAKELRKPGAVHGTYTWGASGPGKGIVIRIPDSMLVAEGVKDARHFAKWLSSTGVHEHRHAWQYYTMGPKRMTEGMKVGAGKHPYLDQPIEIDARAFQGENAIELRNLVKFERVTGGSYINTSPTMKVSPVYARDQLAAWEGAAPREGKGIASIAEGPLGRDNNLITELNDHAWLLGRALREPDVPAPTLPGRPGVPKRSKPPVESQEKFRTVLFKREVAVARAHAEAMARALYHNRAVIQAMSYQESWYARSTYKALKVGLEMWIFATLPLRFFGWTLRNIVDNFAKIIIAGARDPRAFFLGAETPGHGLGGKAVTSLFAMGTREVLHAARTMDGIFGTNVAERLEVLMESFWDYGADVLARIFAAHNIPVPKHYLEGKQFRPWELPARPGTDIRPIRKKINQAIDSDDPNAWAVLSQDKAFQPKTKAQRAAERGRFEKFKEVVWELMATKPENYAKRILFRTTYSKARASNLAKGMHPQLAEEQAVDAAVEAIERTLFDYSAETVLEENLKIIFPFAQFWRKNTRFWLESGVTKPWLPYNFAKFEEQMQQANEDLPEWMRRYLSLEPVADLIAKVPGMDWLATYLEGVGFDQLVADPMNYLSAAPLYRAFKNEFSLNNPLLGDEEKGLPFVGPFLDAMNDWGLSFNPFVRKPLEAAGVVSQRSWQSVFPQTSLASAFTRKYVSENLGYFILNLEHVFTLFQGDPPAEAVAQSFNQYVQMEMAGQAARGETASRARAEEIVRGYIWLQTLLGFTTGVYARRLSPQDIYLYKLRAEIAQGEVDYSDLSEKDQKAVELWKRREANPVDFDLYLETIPYIQAFYRLSGQWEAQQDFKKRHPEIIPFVESAWRGKAWTSNYVGTQQLIIDTDAAIRMFKLAEGLRLDFETTQLATSILVTDELREFWARNDTAKELRGKHLRGLYFRHLWAMNQTFHGLPETDYAAREGYLKEHPELVEFWNLGNRPSDDYAAIFNAVNADFRQAYFEFVDDGDWDGANAFLERHPFIFDAIKNGRFEADRETGRPDAGRSGDFRRGALTQHARDYLAAKRWLDYYFGLAKSERSAWLNSGAAGAEIVLAYFKKYSDNNRVSRFFGTGTPSWAGVRNTELAKRMKFWDIYFGLTPDKRPDFVADHAAEYGIFIYGIFGASVVHQQRQEWLRKAYLSGMSERAAQYFYIKPLLDFFFTLKDRDEKKLFLRANPELQTYLDRWADKTLTGNPQLDKLIEGYFKLPPGSDQRSRYLKSNPEVQDYFDSRSTPAERAMHNLLEQYFDLQGTLLRKDFLLKHPEIQEYFDARAAERDAEKLQLGAFDLADPRYRPFLEGAGDDLEEGAERMRERLLRRNTVVDELEIRRGRRTLA